MKIAQSFKMFAGSVAVYVAVASAYACTGSAGGGATAERGAGDGGTGGMVSDAAGTGGVSETSPAGGGPVPVANADPVPGSRLQSQYRVADDGAKEWLGWHDSLLDAACGWWPMSDGRQHCVPLYLRHTFYFADASCTQKVFTPSCGFTDARRGLTMETVNQCGSLVRVFEVQPLPMGTQMYGLSGANCVSLAGQISKVGDMVSGAEVPPSEFVGSDLVIGP
jgi:hypothetical protein